MHLWTTALQALSFLLPSTLGAPEITPEITPAPSAPVEAAAETESGEATPAAREATPASSEPAPAVEPPTTRSSEPAAPSASVPAPREDAAASAAERERADEEALEAILPDHANVVAALGLSLVIGGSDGSNLGVVGVLDVPVFHPFWLGARARNVGQRTYIDTLASYSVWHERDAGTDTELMTETVGETSTHYIRRSHVYSQAAVLREDFLVSVGMKHEHIRASGEGQATSLDDETGFHSNVLAAGVVWTKATHEGAHDWFELYGLYNTDSGGKGLQILYRNSPSFMPRLFVGMDLAFVPATPSSEFYWACLEFGSSLEL